MKSAGKARNNGLYRHIRTSKEIIRNLLNDYNETKKSSQLRAVQLAALWFYAGIKHKTLKKENRMKFVCIFSRKSGGEKSEGISVNPFRSVVGKPHSRFYAISLNLRGKRKA